MRTPDLFDDPSLLEVRVPVATLWESPEAPRDVDAPALLDDADHEAWAAALDAEGRKGLVGRTATQVLLGEPVRVVAEAGEWVEVRAPWQRTSRSADGYPGWVRRAHLDQHVWRSEGATATVVVGCAPLRMDEGRATTVSLATSLWVDDVRPGEVAVLLPGGRRGWLPASAVRLAEDPAVPGPAEDVLATARLFLGLAYLWGGVSCWGLDCSGLVHLTRRSAGRLVPRDAHDQEDDPGAERLAVDQARPGDLWFFGAERTTHVGLVSDRLDEDGAPLLLHASERSGLVEEVPMDRLRRSSLRSAARLSAG